MLVLSRQRDETITIGDPSPNAPPPIEIMVVDIRGDTVRLGITAPPDIPVHRKEVFAAILAEYLAAAPGIAGGSVRQPATYDPDIRGPEVDSE